MSIPSYKEHMIASAVWFHLERGVDISEIVRYFHPEFEFPDTLYLFYAKDAVDEKVRKAIRMTVVPCAGDSSLGQQNLPRVSLQKACGAFFDKDDSRKQGHVYFKDRRFQMQPPVPDIPDTDAPEINALAQYHFMLKDIRHLIEEDVYSSFRDRCNKVIGAEGSTEASHQSWSLAVISGLNDLYIYSVQNGNEDLMDFVVCLFTVVETEFFNTEPSACIRRSCHLIKKDRLLEDCTGNGHYFTEQSRVAREIREDFLGDKIVDYAHKEREFCRRCQVSHCPYREMLGGQLREYNKTHPQDKRRTQDSDSKEIRQMDKNVISKIKPYLDALVASGYITKEYMWIKGGGHTNYQAAYIAHIIHQTIPTVSQNAIGKLFGIKSISTYLGKLDIKESIKKPLENIFTESKLKVR